MMNDAFHFDSLVWDWPIAIYLFLVGISAGLSIITVVLKQRLPAEGFNRNGILATTAILAPLTVIFGLLILIFHLTKPLAFWNLLVFYNPTSIMSMGVILFQIYLVVLFIWLAANYHTDIERLIDTRFQMLSFLKSWPAKFVPFEKGLGYFLLLLAVMLGAYTGFLLSALKSYPMLNNPVLPVLFLVSALSSGVATAMLCAMLFFKESLHGPSVHFLHHIEKPVIFAEIFVLIVFFSGLWLGDGQKVIAVTTAIGSGFWAQVFWIGIVGIGLLVPLVVNLFIYSRIKSQKGLALVLAGLSLFGVLMLRFFILYAGQMTLA